MFIVRNTEGIINRYLEDFEAGKLRKPECCEHCGGKCKLIWHAKYIRKLITLFKKYDRLPIKRLYCPLCKHTFALIPVFIKKFCRYGMDVIISAIKEFKKKIKRSEVLDRLDGMMEAVDTYIELPTLYRWKKKYSNTV
jgi:hypothetical protein